MQLLPVTAAFDGFHHHILGRHKGQLVHHPAMDNLLIHHHTGRHIAVNIEDGIHRQKGLRHRNALIGAIVQRALKPLGLGGQRRIERIHRDIPRQRTDALTAHGITLIRHGGGTDLALGKRLLYLLKGLQQPQVIGKLIGALGKAGKHTEEIRIHLAGVGLPGDRYTAGKAHILRDQLFHAVDLRLVPIEQLHKAGLCTGGTLGPKQAQVIKLELEIFHIHDQLLQPQSGTLAHRGQLRRLQVGITQAGQRLIPVSKAGQIVHHLRRLLQQQAGGLPQDDHIGIIPHIAAGGPQMDDRLRQRALPAVSIYMAHHVVAHLALTRLGHLVVDILGVRLQLGNLLIRDGKAKLLFRLGQRDPQAPPGAKFEIFRKHRLHLPAGIAGGKRRDIPVLFVGHIDSPSVCADGQPSSSL